ncbi:alkaline phosphatase family protein [Sinomonas sp. ASV486]|uniref:alkaline phosphatase family protein n=1 Tax=Sinomonas sp. ASV486 TaxID=3051170 RepID=UPI0027DB58D2|nr:alkaline phosphatase family protein [Sinomonas sp. ASV486]MDQ4489479.1 alkaline phosphatase family protein [Sinomonas sp. ASV486]
MRSFSVLNRRAGAVVAAVTAAVALTGTVAVAATASPSASNAGSNAASGPDHVFVIMMENHGRDQIIGNTADAPYITSLAERYNTDSNYHGVTHPSLTNYLAAISGDFQGIWDDCKAGTTVKCAPEEFIPGPGEDQLGAFLTPAQVASSTATPHMFSGRTIVDQLEESGKTWKAYMENLPQAGSNVEFAPVVQGKTVKLYAQKHNPFMYFSDIVNSPERLQKIVPLEHNLANDLKTGNVPDFVWVSPNQCHDMHGISPSSAALIGEPQCGYPASGLDHGAIQMGDAYVKQQVSQIMDSETWKTTKSSIVLVWDENDYSGSSGGPGSPVGVSTPGGTTPAVLGGGDAPFIVINSAEGPHKTSGKLADHYTMLSTIEHMWHLGCLANTCSPTTSGTFEELFRP